MRKDHMYAGNYGGSATLVNDTIVLEKGVGRKVGTTRPQDGSLSAVGSVEMDVKWIKCRSYSIDTIAVEPTLQIIEQGNNESAESPPIDSIEQHGQTFNAPVVAPTPITTVSTDPMQLQDYSWCYDITGVGAEEEFLRKCKEYMDPDGEHDR